ncbi:MAG: hypothetical protein ACP5I8_00990 [Phycisphaerae bacterium]
MQTVGKKENSPDLGCGLQQPPTVPLGCAHDSGLGPTDAQKIIISGNHPFGLWVVAVLYILVFLGLIVVSFSTSQIVAWSIAISLVLSAQAALLFIPLKVARRRPIRRGALWVPLVASGFFVSLLVTAGLNALAELFYLDGYLTTWLVVSLFLLTWSAWALIFWWASASDDPASVGFRLLHKVIAGSILELLIVIPAHLIVRQRDECSAGMDTFLGIVVGIAVMFFAFGPAILILLLRRMSQIRPAAGPQTHTPPID